MVWKCPPLHLPNWNNLWKWKQDMNAHDLADSLDVESSQAEYGYIVDDWKLFRDAATMLRQQQDKLTKYELRHAEQRKRIEELEEQVVAWEKSAMDCRIKLELSHCTRYFDKAQEK